MAATIQKLPSELIREITGYLRPEETSLVSKQFNEASQLFQKSYVRSLPSSNPIKRIWDRQSSNSLRERILKTAEAAHKLLATSNTLLTDEEWQNNHVDLASPLGKSDLREMSRRADLIADKRAKILIDFFERLADVLPEAREFLYGLPISLREKAQAIRQWMKDPVNQPFLAQVTHMPIFKDPAMTFEEFEARGDEISINQSDYYERFYQLGNSVLDIPPEISLIRNLDYRLITAASVNSAVKNHEEALFQLLPSLHEHIFQGYDRSHVVNLVLCSGNLDLAKKISEKYFPWNLKADQTLIYAAEKGRMKIVNWLMQEVGFSIEPLQESFEKVPEEFKVELVRLFINRGRSIYIGPQKIRDRILKKAVEKEELALFGALETTTAYPSLFYPSTLALSEALEMAIQKEDFVWFHKIVLNWGDRINYTRLFENKNIEVVRRILSSLLAIEDVSFPRGIYAAIQRGYFRLVQELLTNEPEKLYSLTKQILADLRIKRGYFRLIQELQEPKKLDSLAKQVLAVARDDHRTLKLLSRISYFRNLRETPPPQIFELESSHDSPAFRILSCCDKAMRLMRSFCSRLTNH